MHLSSNMQALSPDPFWLPQTSKRGVKWGGHFMVLPISFRYSTAKLCSFSQSPWLRRFLIGYEEMMITKPSWEEALRQSIFMQHLLLMLLQQLVPVIGTKSDIDQKASSSRAVTTKLGEVMKLSLVADKLWKPYEWYLAYWSDQVLANLPKSQG